MLGQITDELPNRSAASTRCCTALFTDVVDSVGIKVARGDAYYARLKLRHNTLFKALVPEYGGKIADKVGDEYLALFPEAGKALEAALRFNHALAHDPLIAGQLCVRAAVHAGELQEMEDETAEIDRTGLVLDVCSRVLGIARPRQVLLTREVMASAKEQVREHPRLGDAPSPKLEWREHGLYMAKGLTEPIPIFEVGAVGHASFEAPVASGKMWPWRPNNLPELPTTFVGRVAELNEIGLRFERNHRLVTLVGAGGCGKTRLALAYARRALAQFRDGVWFVPLEAVADPNLVAGEILRALAVSEQASRPAIHVLMEHLSVRQCLIVLDNCEHLGSGPGTVASALCRRAPQCRVLATSRVRLDIAGESPFAVPALSLPDEEAQTVEAVRKSDAVALFLERVQTSASGFRMTDELAPTVAKICRAVDGLPLAVELICARLRSMPIQDVCLRLEHVLPLLCGAPRDAANRHQTMSAAIRLSVEALSAPALRVFGYLSVFSGGWSLAGAQAVCSEAGGGLTADEVVVALEQLCDVSLVVFAGAVGGWLAYRFYEPIRQFAADELKKTPNAEAELRDCHARYYEGLAAACEPRLFNGREQRAVLDELEAEHKNLLAALRWCTQDDQPQRRRAKVGLRIASQLWQFWDLRGYITIGLKSLEAALATAPADPQCPFRAKALNSAGYLAVRQGRYEVGRQMSREAQVIRHALGDKLGEARCLHNLGNAALALEDYDEAHRCYGQALDLDRAGKDQFWEAGILGRIGDLLLRTNRLDEAREFTTQAMVLNRAIGNRAWEAIDLHLLADIERASGNMVSARAYYRETLAIRHGLGEKSRIAVTPLDVAGVILADGNAPLAAKLLATADRLRSEIGAQLADHERRRFEQSMKDLYLELGECDVRQTWGGYFMNSWKEATEAAIAWLSQIPAPLRADKASQN